MTDSPEPRDTTAATHAPAAGRFGRASQLNVSRSMLLYALGALIGLVIAGVNLFNAQGTVTNTVPPEDLALINQRPILRSDFITQLETETGKTYEQSSRAEKLRVLDEMIDEELRVQRGLELDFAETDQDTRNALSAVVNAQMIADVTTSEPSTEQLRAYFEQHRAVYASEGILTACNLLLPLPAGTPPEAALARARAAAEELRGGKPLEAVLQRYGMVNLNKCDDDFYFAARIHLGDALFERGRSLADGAVSEPLLAADGVHVLKILRNALPVPMSFEAAHDRVQSDFKTERENLITAATMRFLRRRARILIGPDFQDYKP
jgi:hypothetical protein